VFAGDVCERPSGRHRGERVRERSDLCARLFGRGDERVEGVGGVEVFGAVGELGPAGDRFDDEQVRRGAGAAHRRVRGLPVQGGAEHVRPVDRHALGLVGGHGVGVAQVGRRRRLRGQRDLGAVAQPHHQPVVRVVDEGDGAAGAVAQPEPGTRPPGDHLVAHREPPPASLHLRAGQEAGVLEAGAGQRVELGHIGAARRQQQHVVARGAAVQPGVHHRRPRRRRVRRQMDPPVGVVGDHGAGHRPGAQLGQRRPLPHLGLAAVVDQLDRAGPAGHLREQAAGVDLRQLAVVAG